MNFDLNNVVTGSVIVSFLAAAFGVWGKLAKVEAELTSLGKWLEKLEAKVSTQNCDTHAMRMEAMEDRMDRQEERISECELSLARQRS